MQGCEALGPALAGDDVLLIAPDAEIADRAPLSELSPPRAQIEALARALDGRHAETQLLADVERHRTGSHAGVLHLKHRYST
jgi:hypothetical protein